MSKHDYTLTDDQKRGLRETVTASSKLDDIPGFSEAKAALEGKGYLPEGEWAIIVTRILMYMLNMDAKKSITAPPDQNEMLELWRTFHSDDGAYKPYLSDDGKTYNHASEKDCETVYAAFMLLGFYENMHFLGMMGLPKMMNLFLRSEKENPYAVDPTSQVVRDEMEFVIRFMSPTECKPVLLWVLGNEFYDVEYAFMDCLLDIHSELIKKVDVGAKNEEGESLVYLVLYRFLFEDKRYGHKFYDKVMKSATAEALEDALALAMFRGKSEMLEPLIACGVNVINAVKKRGDIADYWYKSLEVKPRKPSSKSIRCANKYDVEELLNVLAAMTHRNEPICGLPKLEEVKVAIRKWHRICNVDPEFKMEDCDWELYVESLDVIY